MQGISLTKYVEYPNTIGAPAAHWLQIPTHPAKVRRQLRLLKISKKDAPPKLRLNSISA
jgi:hypothetical protein